MASRINRFRNDHETRGRRPKALEAPKEPARPRTHWDHVLEEMVWLAKDFESERKWKMAQAKRVAMRASKSKLDQASRGEKRMKEEEHRVRRLATNISKDVKKFWMKIEKLVLYKHQLELEERKKKALDKQLDFLLGQTERYSTMLAENLVDLPFSYERSSPHLSRTMPSESVIEQSGHQNEKDTELAEGHDCSEPYSDSDRSSESPFQICASVEEPDSKDLHKGSHLHNVESEDEFCLGSEDDLEDDEATLEADEALITKEERREELAALQDEIDLPIEELLKRYGVNEGDEEESTESHDEDDSEKCTEQNLQQNRVATTVGENVAGRSVGTRERLCDNQQENMALFPSAGALKDDPKNAVSNEARTSASQRLDVEEVDVNRSVSLLVDLGEYTDHSPVPSAGNSMSTATILDKGGGQDVELLDRKFIRRADSRREGITMKESPMASDSDNENAV